MSNDMHLSPIDAKISQPGFEDHQLKKNDDPALAAIKEVQEDFAFANTKDLDSHKFVEFPVAKSAGEAEGTESAEVTDDFFSEMSDEEASFSEETAQKVESVATIINGLDTETSGAETKAASMKTFAESQNIVNTIVLSIVTSVQNNIKKNDIYCTDNQLVYKVTKEEVDEMVKANKSSEEAQDAAIPPEQILKPEQLEKLPKRILSRLAAARVLKQVGPNGLEDISQERVDQLAGEVHEDLLAKFKNLGWLIQAPLPQENTKEAEQKLAHTYTLVPKQEIATEVKFAYKKGRELPEEFPIISKIVLSSTVLFSKINSKDKEKKAEEERERIYEQIIFREIIRTEIKRFELKRQNLNETIIKVYHSAFETHRYFAPTAAAAA